MKSSKGGGENLFYVHAPLVTLETNKCSSVYDDCAVSPAEHTVVYYSACDFIYSTALYSTTSRNILHRREVEGDRVESTLTI